MCSSSCGPVGRILYRDIRVHFNGWESTTTPLGTLGVYVVSFAHYEDAQGCGNL